MRNTLCYRLWWLIQWARFEWGWNTRRSYPNKPYLYVGFDYYDGMWWALHLGPLWICAGEWVDEERTRT